MHLLIWSSEFSLQSLNKLITKSWSWTQIAQKDHYEISPEGYTQQQWDLQNEANKNLTHSVKKIRF